MTESTTIAKKAAQLLLKCCASITYALHNIPTDIQRVADQFRNTCAKLVQHLRSCLGSLSDFSNICAIFAQKFSKLVKPFQPAVVQHFCNTCAAILITLKLSIRYFRNCKFKQCTRNCMLTYFVLLA